MLGSLILCLKGMRIMMFQLSGFYYRRTHKGGAFISGLLYIMHRHCLSLMAKFLNES